MIINMFFPVKRAIKLKLPFVTMNLACAQPLIASIPKTKKDSHPLNQQRSLGYFGVGEKYRGMWITRAKVALSPYKTRLSLNIPLEAP